MIPGRGKLSGLGPVSGSFDGKVVAITGAGSGIGRALAAEFASRGADLALCDVAESGLRETADHVRARFGRDPFIARVDVAVRAEVAEFASSVTDRFGRANIIVNNAGVGLMGDFGDLAYEDIEWIVGINFWGVVYGTKEFLPHLIDSGDGHVVNVSSLAGMMAFPGQTAYHATKFAVRGFTESFREEMLLHHQPIAVTCVHPGGVKTGIARAARVAGGINQEHAAQRFDERLARTTPETAAATIVRGVQRRRARVLVGADAHLLHNFARVVGWRYQDMIIRSRMFKA